MKIAGRLGALIGSWLSIMIVASPTFAQEENCDIEGLVTNKKLERLPKNAVLKVHLIEAVLQDVDSPVIVGEEMDVSSHVFPIKFNLALDCSKLNGTIMPSFDIRVELDDKLLFNNDTVHPFAHEKILQQIEVKKTH